jgi:hypothetical protein
MTKKTLDFSRSKKCPHCEGNDVSLLHDNVVSSEDLFKGKVYKCANKECSTVFFVKESTVENLARGLSDIAKKL